MPRNKIVLGTRGSELALAQTRLVEEALRAAFPDIVLELRIIKTRGDKIPNESPGEPDGRKGLFTREIEEALRRGEIDVAVHSAKDLPSGSADDLEIRATRPRASVSDILVMKNGISLDSLSAQAIVATGSVRRQHQLQWKRPDLRIVTLRGNVPTRLRKLIENEWDAIVLACAGLARLGHDFSKHTLEFEGHSLRVEELSSDDFLPAGGQGVIAIEVRRNDQDAAQFVDAINHRATLLCLRAEREFLRLLAGDCNSPVGVLATIDDHQEMTVRAQVFEANNKAPKVGKICSSLRTQEPEEISVALYNWIHGEG